MKFISAIFLSGFLFAGENNTANESQEEPATQPHQLDNESVMSLQATVIVEGVSDSEDDEPLQRQNAGYFTRDGCSSHRIGKYFLKAPSQKTY